MKRRENPVVVRPDDRTAPSLPDAIARSIWRLQGIEDDDDILAPTPASIRSAIDFFAQYPHDDRQFRGAFAATDGGCSFEFVDRTIRFEPTGDIVVSDWLDGRLIIRTTIKQAHA